MLFMGGDKTLSLLVDFLNELALFSRNRQSMCLKFLSLFLVYSVNGATASSAVMLFWITRKCLRSIAIASASDFEHLRVISAFSRDLCLF